VIFFDYRLKLDEMNHLLLENYFMEDFRSKLEDPMIQKFIRNLARELVAQLDVRKEGGVDVRYLLK
jgi:hypothetical protein